MQKITTDLAGNMEYFQEKLGLRKSFDIICRTTMVADRPACFYFIDGFVKDDIMEKLMEFFYSITPEDLPEDSSGLSGTPCLMWRSSCSATGQRSRRTSCQACSAFLSTDMTNALPSTARTYPMRSVSEPEKDKVLRGSKDGFVETVVFNTALIRRRIRDPRLVMEMLQAGSSSKTDIVLCYMDDRVDRSSSKRSAPEYRN